MKRIIFVFFLIIIWISNCTKLNSQNKVLTGLDRISEYINLFENKNIGIITNHTAYTQDDIFIVDVFKQIKTVNIVALFGPEHGIKGNASAGVLIDDTLHTEKHIPVYSLYGESLKPTNEMLENCDLLVFDIQDIGCRYYTYISTMALAMEAAAENNIPFIVMDRPNPINGVDVEGNLMEKEFASFVGMFPVPVRHGLTVGEYAQMINGEGWLKDNIQVELKVITITGWDREMWFDETGLKWRPTSPNMPDLQTAIIYPGICLFEGTNISEGRGTYQPFLRIGAPWFNVNSFESINTWLDIPGLRFATISFTPRSIPGMAENPKYLNIRIQGLQLAITNRDKINAYLAGIELVKFLYDQNKEKFQWRESHFDRLCGTDKIRQFIISRKPMSEIRSWCEKDIESFKEQRKKYLLY